MRLIQRVSALGSLQAAVEEAIDEAEAIDRRWAAKLFSAPQHAAAYR
jgi:hypothetical protein